VAFEMAVIRQSFFNTESVMRKVKAGRKRALSKIGAYVRQRARTSIRRRKKSSPPGQPPSAHSGEIKLIFFGYDDRSGSVVVGFVRARSKTSGSGVVPRLLEGGGDVTRRTPKGLRRLHYRGNPTMGPAEASERPRFADAFRECVR
jgi:hypothetical protein